VSALVQAWAQFKIWTQLRQGEIDHKLGFTERDLDAPGMMLFLQIVEKCVNQS